MTLKFLALHTALYIYDISRLRVNVLLLTLREERRLRVVESRGLGKYLGLRGTR
jgi:hypothetical protein